MDFPAMASAAARTWLFETFLPPLQSVKEGLASADPALALAAAKALERRVLEGADELSALAACVPGDVFSLPHDALAIVAELAVRGLPVAMPPLPADLPPLLQGHHETADRAAGASPWPAPRQARAGSESRASASSRSISRSVSTSSPTIDFIDWMRRHTIAAMRSSMVSSA